MALTLWRPGHCCHMGTAIKHPVPDQVKPSFVIFDIRALWRSVLSVKYNLNKLIKRHRRKQRSFSSLRTETYRFSHQCSQLFGATGPALISDVVFDNNRTHVLCYTRSVGTSEAGLLFTKLTSLSHCRLCYSYQSVSHHTNTAMPTYTHSLASSFTWIDYHDLCLPPVSPPTRVVWAIPLFLFMLDDIISLTVNCRTALR